MTLRVGSLFSGAGGFDLGLERAGMTTVFQCEWDEKCQSVLRRHWPDVPKWHDVSDVRGVDLPDCDLIAFGSPCQDLSIAGKRAGMVAGETRSGLFFEAIRLIKELQDDGRGPTWVVWENVAGALTSSDGNDFAAVIDSMGELGSMDTCWRVLDAQWFGNAKRPVPQRRRRVFVVACLRPRPEGAREVLPLGAGVRRDSSQSGKQRTHVAALTANGVGTCGADDNQATAGHLVPVVNGSTIYSFDSKWSGEFGISVNVTPPMKLGGGCVPAITDPFAIDGAVAVRRLTPRECERLQGWDDDWTRWSDDGVEINQSARYRMIGNGVCSPVATWVGTCINAADEADSNLQPDEVGA